MLTMGRRRIRSQQRMAALARQPPFRQEERIGGYRRGAESQAPPHGAWSKATPGGRRSAGGRLCSVHCGEGPGSRPLSCSPQCAPPRGREATELVQPPVTAT